MILAFENYTTASFLDDNWEAVIHQIICTPIAQSMHSDSTYLPTTSAHSILSASQTYYSSSISNIPTNDPADDPTYELTVSQPSILPSMSTSTSPSKSPSTSPSISPSTSPSISPSTSPSKSPSTSPSKSPSTSPSGIPSSMPSSTAPTTLSSRFEIEFWANWTIPYNLSKTDEERAENLQKAFVDVVNALQKATNLSAVTAYLQQIAKSNGVTIMERAVSTTSKNTSQLIFSLVFLEPPSATPLQTVRITALSTADATGIAIGVGVCTLGIIILLIVICCKQIILPKHHKGVDVVNVQLEEPEPEEYRNSSLFEYFSRKESLSTPRGTENYESFNVTLHVGINRNVQVAIPKFEWSDILIDSQTRFLGAGNFGRVVRVCLTTSAANRCGMKPRRNIAVKIMVLPRNDQAKADEIITRAKEEVAISLSAENKIGYKSCVVHMYGMCTGEIPKYICAHPAVQLANETKAVGILMRMESGGTLSSRIHPHHVRVADSSAKTVLSTTEKLRILSGVARGISELHAAGVIHGDLKPDNVLLSSHNPSLIRLADFGLAVLKLENGFIFGDSTLYQTKNFKGTPIYAAPEMLFNPHEEASNMNADFVATASRKTDVYAFAILSWEVLCQQVPFKKQGIKSAITLGSWLHQGFRPEIDELPSDCPSKVKLMIQKCWSRDRTNRLTALQCYSILQGAYDALVGADCYDVCLCYHWKSLDVVEYVAHHLNRFGLKIEKICPNDFELVHDVDKEVIAVIDVPGINWKSKAAIVFAGVAYHANESCMDFLHSMAEFKLSATNVPLAVYVDPPNSEWIDDFEVICQLGASCNRAYDLSNIAGISWDTVGDDYASKTLEGSIECVNEQIHALAKKLLSIKSG